MILHPLNAISPIDGRYRKSTNVLATYFSESALIKYRVWVEVEYYIALSKLGLKGFEALTHEQEMQLRELYIGFKDERDAARIKEIELTTNHDVKAVEYFLKEKLEELNITHALEYIHFGLTSQDINNTAIPMSLKHAVEKIMLPEMHALLERLKKLADEWKDIPLLAHTHGQPASPTRLGKEILVFIERIEVQLTALSHIPYAAKFGGATGNLNAHKAAFPAIDWVLFANDFVNNNLGLHRSQHTTQIEHYDQFAAMCDNFKRINSILIDLSRDMWQYISMNYFKQKIKEGEIGSSAMPHKVNPIDFENAEGNLGMANAMFEFLSAKLPISRLQRDLTDSTVLRNVGVPFAHSLIALKSLEKGLFKLMLNPAAIEKDLEENWAVVAEAIQTILRREGYPKPYEALKDLTRTNAKITQESMHAFIERLNVSEEIKAELKSFSPHNYTGY